MCICLCVTETPWDTLLSLLEKVNTVKVSLCKEWKVVCADTQTIADTVWTGCSHIVIPVVHLFKYMGDEQRHILTNMQHRWKMQNKLDCWLKFGFWSKPTVRTASLTRQLCNWTFHAGLFMQVKGTFSTLSSTSSLMIINMTKSNIPDGSKEAMRASYLQSCPRCIDKPQLSVWWSLMPAVSLLQKPEERFPAGCLHGAAASDV